MASFLLAPAALADLEDIETYTLETWGTAQRDQYVRALFERFERIAKIPLAGRERSELAPGVRSSLHAHHVVFYEVIDGRCVILRVLHERRDVTEVFRA